MASSLPDNTGGHKPSKLARGFPNTITSSDAVHNSYGSVDTLCSRKCATADFGPLVPPGTLLDRRSKVGNQRPTPLNLPQHLGHVNIKDDASTPHAPHSQNTSLHTSLRDEPSAPITIPRRKSPTSRPITPLTGREPSLFVHSPKLSHTPPQRTTSKDFTPSPDSHSQSPQSEQEVFAHSPINRRAMRLDRGGHTPSSPLSPTMAAYSTSPLNQQSGRAHPNSSQSRGQLGPLAIPSLPPFHPANYESRNSSPRSYRPATATHGRQLSDAQKKLHRYQRELVINATRTAGGASVTSPVPRPTSPRLNPLGSPGPVTPMMLEGQSDYFLAGSGTASSSALKDSGRRETVDRLIATERDRIAHPERADRHSPAVSPAGGPR